MDEMLHHRSGTLEGFDSPLRRDHQVQLEESPFPFDPGLPFTQVPLNLCPRNGVFKAYLKNQGTWVQASVTISYEFYGYNRGY